MTDVEDLRMLRDVVSGALERHRRGGATGVEADWDLVIASGWESAGLGPGGRVGEIVTVVEQLGAHAVSVPIVEHHLARWLLAQTSFEPCSPRARLLMVPPGSPVTVTATRGATGCRLRGRVARVPWARTADHLLLYVRDENREVLAGVPADADGLTIEPGQNLAGEPRDTVVLDGCTVTADAVTDRVPDRTTIQLRAGLLNAAAIHGALERARGLAVTHATTREQFGRPLARFDAVAAHLATIAAEVDLVGGAVRRATHAHDEAVDRLLHTAAAKVVAAAAAGVVAERAHQVLGALGTTREHPLHLSTTRLLSWRDEWGTQTAWSRALAEYAGGLGTDEFWAVLTL